MEEQNLLLEEEKEYKRFYKFSLWWIGHRVLLRKIGYGALIAFDSVLLLFVLWTVIDTFAISYESEQLETSKMVAYGQSDLRSYSVANKADSLIEDTVRVFPLGNSRYDFYADLSNPNSDWWVEFDYSFSFNSGNTQSQKGFLLPGQQKPVIALAVSSQTPVQNASLELTNIVWHRVDHHLIPDYISWQEERMRLEISDASYAKETGFEKESFGRTTFTVFNNTAYSYFDPVFYVVFKRGTTVVGVSRATVASLDAGEHREITLNWFGVLPSVGSVEVIPDIQIFDSGVYKPQKGEAGIDTRVNF